MFRTDYKGTVGVDFALKILTLDKDTIIKLQLWDIAGNTKVSQKQNFGVAKILTIC